MGRCNLSDEREMANGMRDSSGKPLSESEITYVKSEIKRIGADESVFVFNDEKHITSSTCYNYSDDKIYVTRNVFQDVRYGVCHPRDQLSVGAVLAHEYYGHRPYREEYLSDDNKGCTYHTTPLWLDEFRASLSASESAPNLTDEEKKYLVLDAVSRAEEAGYILEMDDYMKQTVYGYSKEEMDIAHNAVTLNCTDETGRNVTDEKYQGEIGMNGTFEISRDNDDFER